LSRSHAGPLVVERIILKFAVAGAALLLGLTAPAVAQPSSDDSYDAASTRYDSPDVIRKIGSASRSRDSYTSAPSGRRGVESKRGNRSHSGDCFDCQPRPHYDDQKVIKKVRNVDHSRVINTVTVVPAGRRVGVIRHNHIIVEKEIRYVRRAPATTTVNFVTHNYRVTERPAAVTMTIVPRRDYECGVGLGGYRNSCGPLRVRD
jgi:hypothetical protein